MSRANVQPSAGGKRWHTDRKPRRWARRRDVVEAERPVLKSAREVVLRARGAADSLRRGHPWVWREAVERGLEGARVGEDVQVVAADGTPVGCGIVDPGS